MSIPANDRPLTMLGPWAIRLDRIIAVRPHNHEVELERDGPKPLTITDIELPIHQLAELLLRQ